MLGTAQSALGTQLCPPARHGEARTPSVVLFGGGPFQSLEFCCNSCSAQDYCSLTPLSVPPGRASASMAPRVTVGAGCEQEAGAIAAPACSPVPYTPPSEAASPPCHAPSVSAHSQPRLRPGSSGQRRPYPSHPDLTRVAFLCLAGSYVWRVVTTAGLVQGLSAAGRDLHPGQSRREACSGEPGCRGPRPASSALPQTRGKP